MNRKAAAVGDRSDAGVVDKSVSVAKSARAEFDAQRAASGRNRLERWKKGEFGAGCKSGCFLLWWCWC